MLGPLLQGFLLMSVVYWYSKGMLNLINDYYRDEFKTFIDEDVEKSKESKVSSIEEKLSDTKKIKIDLSNTSPEIKGLPDNLESTTKKTYIKRDSIISLTTIPKKTKEIEPITTLNVNKNDDNIECSSSKESIEKSSTNKEELLDSSIKFDYVSRLNKNDINVVPILDDDECTATSQMTTNDINTKKKPILNPSAINKLDYKQIRNQQVTNSFADDDVTFMTGKKYKMNPQNRDDINGNYACSVGSTKGENLFHHSDHLSNSKQIDFHIIDKNIDNNIKNEKYQQDYDNRISNEQNKSRETCSRKTVNEMVQFWTDFQISQAEENENQISKAKT